VSEVKHNGTTGGERGPLPLRGTPDERRRAVLDRLLPALEELLVDHTYDEISVEQLAAQAGIARSTFYVHFEGKADLIEALGGGIIDGVMASADVPWALPPGADLADLEAALTRLLEDYLPHRPVHRALIEAGATDPGIAERYRAAIDRTMLDVADHIRRGQAQGDVDAGVDPDATAALLSWMDERGALTLVPPREDPAFGDWASAMATVYWRTLYAGAR
jgi:AcrR family transcriptional regulator